MVGEGVLGVCVVKSGHEREMVGELDMGRRVDFVAIGDGGGRVWLFVETNNGTIIQ